jgi:hypothetical protein
VTNGAALCVGVSRYNDAGLVPLPEAAVSAREIQKALDARLLPATAAIVDPASNGDLFLRIQKAAGEARGGTFFFYFAGHALRRGGDLLLATRDTELAGAKGCVPWSDVLGILKREGVAGGMALLNVDQPVGAARPQLDGGSVAVVGSLRTYDAAGANASLRGYADVVLAALLRPAADIETFLSDGVLDAGGLHRYLAARAPRTAPHASFSMPAQPALLRDFAQPASLTMRSSMLPPASTVGKPATATAPESARAPASATAPAPATESARAPASASDSATSTSTPTSTSTEPPPHPTAIEPLAASVPPTPTASVPPTALAPEAAPLEAKMRPLTVVAPASPASRVGYAMFAAAFVVAAVVYALLRS